MQHDDIRIIQMVSHPYPNVSLNRNLAKGIRTPRAFRWAKSFRSDIQHNCHDGHLEALQTTVLPQNHDASGQIRHLELLTSGSFRSDFQDRRSDSYLEILQSISSQTVRVYVLNETETWLQVSEQH